MASVKLSLSVCFTLLAAASSIHASTGEMPLSTTFMTVLVFALAWPPCLSSQSSGLRRYLQAESDNPKFSRRLLSKSSSTGTLELTHATGYCTHGEYAEFLTCAHTSAFTLTDIKLALIMSGPDCSQSSAPNMTVSAAGMLQLSELDLT